MLTALSLVLVKPASAQSIETEVARTARLQQEFISGKIGGCSILRVRDGSSWMVMGIDRNRALMRKRDNTRPWWLRFDDLQALSELIEVVRYGSGDEPWFCVTR